MIHIGERQFLQKNFLLYYIPREGQELISTFCWEHGDCQITQEHSKQITDIKKA